MQIIVFLLGLSLLITIHELGHFIVAKIFGVYCHEFSIGMGPAIFSKKKGETKYSLRWLPIGGYVSMAGEEVDSDIKEPINENENNNIQEETIKIDNEVTSNEDENTPKIDIPYERTINGIKPWKRFLVIGAGVFMNFVLAYILFFVALVSIGIANPAPYIDVSYDSKDSEVYVFEQAGINEGILKVDGITSSIVYIHNGEEIKFENADTNFYGENIDSYDEVKAAVGFIPNNIGSTVATFDSDITKVTKDGIETITFKSKNYTIIQKLTIFSEGKEYYPNRTIDEIVFEHNISKDTYSITSIDKKLYGFSQSRKDASLGEYLKGAAVWEADSGLAIFDALGQLFTKEGMDNVGGIIAMADASNTYLEYGFGYYMAFLGLISVNLGVMNLLPIPGLDGSQLLVIIVEGITRKKLPNNAKAIINFIGLIFLMGLMILITIKDVFKFII